MKAMLLESTKIILDTDAGQITAVGLTADARRLLSTDGELIVIARVDDPGALLDGKRRRLHRDVVDVLVDLAVSLLDEAIAP